MSEQGQRGGARGSRRHVKGSKGYGKPQMCAFRLNEDSVCAAQAPCSSHGKSAASARCLVKVRTCYRYVRETPYRNAEDKPALKPRCALQLLLSYQDMQMGLFTTWPWQSTTVGMLRAHHSSSVWQCKKSVKHAVPYSFCISADNRCKHA